MLVQCIGTITAPGHLGHVCLSDLLLGKERGDGFDTGEKVRFHHGEDGSLLFSD